MAPPGLEEMKKQLTSLLEKGYIRPSSSPWGCLVPTHDHHPQKLIEGLLKMPAQGSFLIHGGIEAVLTIAVIDGTICNNGNKTLSTRKYSARLTHHKPEIK